MNWILENWQGIIGGGSISTIIVYIFNRKTQKADFLTKVGGIYDKLVDTLTADREKLKEEVSEFRQDFKMLRADYRSIQDQFNNINLAYAKEVERSQNWEKLHRELMEKYSDLEKDYEELKKDHEKLKKEFELHKKNNVK